MPYNYDEWLVKGSFFSEQDTNPPLDTDPRLNEVESLDDILQRNAIPPATTSSLQQRLGLRSSFDYERKSTEMLLAELFHRDWTVRMASVQALEIYGDRLPPSAISALRNLLKNDLAPVVQAAAARVLGVVGGDAQRQALLLAYANREWRVRAAVIQALGMFGQKAPVETIEKAIEDDPDMTVRAVAAWALGAIQHTSSIVRLVAALDDEDELVRVAAVEALGNFGSKAPVAAFVFALDDEDDFVRAAAAVALRGFGAQAPLEDLLFALQDESVLVRVAAIETLGLFGEQAPLEGLLSMLTDEDVAVRVAAVKAVGNAKKNIPLDALILCLKDPDATVEAEISAILQKITDDVFMACSIELLSIALCDEKNVKVRSTAVWALGKSKREAAVNFILGALDDKDEKVRASAIWALGDIRALISPKSLIAVLQVAVLQDPDSAVRIAAVNVLEDIGEQMLLEPLEPLIAALQDLDKNVRTNVVRVLAKQGERTPLEPLLRAALKDDIIRPHIYQALGTVDASKHSVSERFLQDALKEEQEEFRAFAVWIFGERGDLQSIEALVTAAQDRSPLVRDAADWAILQLQKMYDSPQREDDLGSASMYMKVYQALKKGENHAAPETLLLALLTLLEEKKGFVVAESCSRETLVLTFAYQEEVHIIRDIILHYVGFINNVESFEHAHHSLDDDIRAAALQLSKRRQQRPWSEILMLAFDIPRQNSAPEINLTRVIICTIGYSQVRNDDIPMYQQMDYYFGPDNSPYIDEHVQRLIVLAYRYIRDLRETRLWYSSTPRYALPRLARNKQASLPAVNRRKQIVTDRRQGSA